MPDEAAARPILDRRLWWLLGAYCLLLFGATHTPAEEMRHVGFAMSNDKAVHFTAYAVLGCLAAVCLTPRRGRLAVLTGVAIVAVIAIAGAVDEFTQPWVRRTCDPFDWIADVLGAVAGVSAYGVWTRWRSPRAAGAAQ